MHTKNFLCTLLSIALLLFITLLSGCGQRKIVIGASIAGSGEWTKQLSKEISLACGMQPNMRLDMRRVPMDDPAQQQHQMDSLINAHVDLIIFDPCTDQSFQDELQRAKKAGIPVIVVDRKTNSNDFTAYIGRDDKELGRLQGEYLALRRKGMQTNILVVDGLQGSSPSKERTIGFNKAIAKYPNLHIVGTAAHSWIRDSVRIQGMKFLKQHPNLHIDCVAGQGDNIVMGMREAIEQVRGRGDICYFGIDGLSGKNGGLNLVRRGLLEATVINPTRGYLVVDLAMKILNGQPFQRINLLQTTVVNKFNIDVVMTQNEMIEEQEEAIQSQNSMITQFYRQFHHVHVYIVLNLIILLLILSSFFLIRYISALNRRNSVERVRLRLENYLMLQAKRGHIDMSDNNICSDAESNFMGRLFDSILKHANDSTFNAEMAAQEIGISTQKLVTIIKKITNLSVEQIIDLTRKTIQQKKVNAIF